MFQEKNLTFFFENYISGTASLVPGMIVAAEYLGLVFEKRAYRHPSIREFGFFIENNKGLPKVHTVLEGTVGETVGLAKGDEIVAVNGIKVTTESIQGVLNMFKKDSLVEIHCFRTGHLKTFLLTKDIEKEPFNYVLKVNELADEIALQNREKWVQVNNKIKSKA